MSKFLNESRKASQLPQRRVATEELDVRQVLETVKQAAYLGDELGDVGVSRSRTLAIPTTNHFGVTTEQHQFAKAAQEAYRGLRTKLLRIQADSGFRSFAITSSQPSEGKTLTAMNLALCYAQAPEQRVLLIDADLRTRALTRQLEQSGEPSLPGLTEVLEKGARPEESIFVTDHKNLLVMPSGSPSLPPAESFTGSRWMELLSWCSETFTVVLVDTPPVIAPIADFELISAACHGILMVTHAQTGQCETLKRAVGLLDPRKLVGLVFNAVDFDPNDGHDYGY